MNLMYKLALGAALAMCVGIAAAQNSWRTDGTLVRSINSDTNLHRTIDRELGVACYITTQRRGNNVYGNEPHGSSISCVKL